MKPASLTLAIIVLSAVCLLDCLSGTVASESSSPVTRRSRGSGGPIRFGSFNIQVFGRKKVSDAFVMNNLARILARYHILVVMEIRDSSGQAFRKLVERANRDLRSDPFSYVISKRTGRTMSKEQYAVLYRESVADVLSHWTVADPADRFQREPFAVRLLLKSSTRRPTSLTVICLHTEPEGSVIELNALHDIVKPMRLDNLIIAGDLNADCRYVNRGEMADLPLRLDPDFLWLIGDGVDTTVKSTDCAYDRLIATHSAMQLVAAPRVFRFDTEYGLSTDEAVRISDHYPVELEIRV